MEFVNFVEVVLDDDDEDEGTEASELFFFRYWYDICTSSLLLNSLTLSLCVLDENNTNSGEENPLGELHDAHRPRR